MESKFTKADTLDALHAIETRLLHLDGMYSWDLEIAMIREALEKAQYRLSLTH